jgi:hypothetical protein
VTTEPGTTPPVSPDDLARVADARVFFGHQSVGQNVLDGVRAVYEESSRPAPPIEDALIGANGQPVRKIEDFDSRMRAGIGDRVDVAMMKLCYVDIDARTDVESLFETYRSTMAALEKDLPGVAFVHVTTPLTTEPGRLASLKARLTGSQPYGPAENANRERLNALLRREYSGHVLLDLAAVESTTPSGERVGGEIGGGRYYALYDGYASDDGHLNPDGAKVAAAAWLAAVAGAVRRSQE